MYNLDLILIEFLQCIIKVIFTYFVDIYLYLFLKIMCNNLLQCIIEVNYCFVYALEDQMHSAS